MTSADLPSSSKPGGVTLAELEKRLSLTEKSRFTNRLRTTIILVGNEVCVMSRHVTHLPVSFAN
jgi:hypothetical protein